MELSVVNYYLEPGNELEFAYSVNKKICKTLERKYINSTQLKNEKKGFVLSVNASPSKKVKKIILMGPHTDRVNKYLNYTIRIPYKEIVRSSNPIQTYSMYIEEGLKMILNRDFNFVSY